MNKKLYFSLLSGEIYEIEEDEVKNLDKYQIPLLSRPRHSCRKCYGRLYTGYNATLKVFQICQPCVDRHVDFKSLPAEEFQIETPKHV